MGKIVKIVLVVAVVVALTYFGQPHLAAMFASAGLSAAAAAAAAAMVVAVATAAASSLIMGRPKGIGQAMFDRLTTSLVPTAPRKIVFGRTAAGADERYHEKATFSGTAAAVASNIIATMFGGGSAKKSDYLFRVIALASHKVNAVKEVYLEDELCFNGTSTVGKFTTKSGLMIQAVTEGNTGNAAAWGSGTYWTSSSKFTGCSYLKMAQRLDSDVYPDGLPQRFTAIVEGCPVYDPRLDSTNGGSGSHRPDDQSTWSYYNSTDPIGRNSALCLLTYLLGWRINGKIAWGLGVEAERINLSNFITYANVCDESVAASGGGTIKRYQCDGIFSTADTHESIITTITATMGTARLVDTNGLYQLVGGFDDLDGPIIEFTEDDLLGQYEWRPSVAIRERYNIARGRFPNPEKLYQLEDWGEVAIDPLADGIPRTLVIELGGVSRSETCQRIAKQALVRNAYTGTFAGVFGPKAFSVQVGSLVSMSVAKEGWNNKLFRVIDYNEEHDLIFQMTLQEEHANIYEWDSDEAVDLPPDVRPPAYDPNATEDVADLAATSSIETTSQGGTVSRITVTWTEPEASVSSINIQYSTDNVVWTEAAARYDHRAEEFIFEAPVSGILTHVRARFRMFSGIYGDWETTSITAAEASDGGIAGYLTDESVTFAADSSGTIL